MQIFNISGWVGTIPYSQYDTVSVNVTGATHYYYSVVDNNSGVSPTGANDKWTRFPILAFAPSYSTDALITNNNTKINFGDGYSQKITNYLDSDKLQFTLKYINANKKKTIAISNFIINTHAVDPFVFNPSGIFKSSHSFIANSPKIQFGNYDSYNIDIDVLKVFEVGNYYDTINLDVKSNSVVYFFSGLSIEPGQYKIKYRNGVAATASTRWFETTNYTISYNNGDNTYDWYITGNGTGTNESWSTEELGAAGMKKAKPEININHTGGRLGISFFDSNYTDNISGNPPLSYSLYKIKDL